MTAARSWVRCPECTDRFSIAAEGPDLTGCDVHEGGTLTITGRLSLIDWRRLRKKARCLSQ